MPRARRDAVDPSPSAAPEVLVARLEAMGLSRNEALALLTLLEDTGGQGLTGYEVAARSSIPRSAVYTVLRRLTAAGAAFELGDPPRYVAQEPAEWLAQVRRAADARMDELRASLDALPKRARPEPIWTLRRYDEVMRRIDELIRGATQSVWLSLWPREVLALRPALEAIAEHPLHRVLHSPAALSWTPPGFICWVDSVDGDEAKATWSHKALVVVDRRQALIGGTEPAADNHAVSTTNPSLVDSATNHIILDITLMSRATGVDPTATVSPMMRPHLIPIYLQQGPEGLK